MRGAKSPASARPQPAGYSGTPLWRKLGLKPDTVTALVGAPDGFPAALADRPAGAELRTDLRQAPALAVFFVADRRVFTRVLPKLQQVLESGAGAWVAWPKKTSPLYRDLDENIIRDEVLARGLVDIKVCAVDATWSGLRIARRRTM